MSLINEQAIFLQDMMRLIAFVIAHGFVVTGGELFRTQEQQEIYLKNGKSKTKNSMHLKRCAIDLNIFTMTEGKPILCTDGDKIKSIGDYWESLDEKNRWGGNWKWKDINHFERSVV